MKKISVFLLFTVMTFVSQAQTFICSTSTCGGGTTILSSAPTDGSTFYIVWFTTSANTIISATATPQPSATSGTANIGSTTITNTGGTNYRISIAASIVQNQGKPTVSNVDVNLAFYTSASFPGTAGTAAMSIPTANPLPVDFLDINVTSTASYNKVVWSTASETNNDRFEIERSYDGTNWDVVNVLNGAGNSSQVLNYEFHDILANTILKSFYRIKQVDFNGESTYSDVVKVRPVVKSISIFPNPSKGSEVSIITDEIIETFEVRNLAGQVLNVPLNEATKKFNVSELADGLYFVKINNSVVRFVK